MRTGEKTEMENWLVTDKTKCCGCTACAAACPSGCIEMKPDFEGFLYPSVDLSRCVHCDLCRRVCPVTHPAPAGSEPRRSFVVRAKDMDTVLNSTSGGFFTPLADCFLRDGGVICAASFTDSFEVVHTFLDESDRTEAVYRKVRGSKYVQSAVGDSYRRVRIHLERGKRVCFIGTTCQVAGLKRFLRRDYDGLITVDVVCHGTPSPKLWRKYLDTQSKRYGSPIAQISFRNKTYGYHSGTMKIVFENGKEYYGSARVDWMLKSFFKEISSRPICYQCPFKTLERCSDLTLYDCWHPDQLVPGLRDDDRGYTNVIVQSEKGMQLLEAMRGRMEMHPADTETAVRLDGVMVRRSAKPHPKRDEFYRDLDQTELPDHIQKFLPISRKDRILEQSKGMLYRLGVLRVLRKVVKKK